MRFLISDVLTGACFAALVVFASDRHAKLAVASVSRAAPISHERVEREQVAVAQASSNRPADEQRYAVHVEEGKRSAAAIETASLGADEGVQRPEAAVVSRLPSFMRPEPKPSGGLGAAADGGVDAYVAPILRQRPKSPSLTGAVPTKPKEKVKASTTAKAKASAKQAQRAVTPASVKR